VFPELTGRPYTLAAMLASLHEVIHWPTHGGYNFISGPLADITLATAFLSWMYLWLRKHNCHVNGCVRLAWHPHPDHGHPVCKKHHPEGYTIKA
jgi:hypothetical protein